MRSYEDELKLRRAAVLEEQLKAHRFRAERSRLSPLYPYAPHLGTFRLLRDWAFALNVMTLLALFWSWVWNLTFGWNPQLFRPVSASEFQLLWTISHGLLTVYVGAFFLVILAKVIDLTWYDDDLPLEHPQDLSPDFSPDFPPDRSREMPPTIRSLHPTDL